MDFLALFKNPVFIISGVLFLVMVVILISGNSTNKTNQQKSTTAVKIFILFFGFFYLVSALTRYLGMDELEHIQSSWLLSTGKIPYVDFFQHHHGLIWYIYSFVFKVFGDSIFSVIIIRLLNLSFVFGTLYLVYKISLETTLSKNIALYTLAIALSINIFMRNASYIRPDVLMTFMMFLSFLFFVKFWNKRKNIFLVFSGICMAFSFFALQKATFYILPFFAGLIFMVFSKKISFQNLVVLAVSAFIPLLIFLGIFWFSGYFKEYITLNWIYNFLKPGKNPFHRLFIKPSGFVVCTNFVLLFILSLFSFIKENKSAPLLLNFAFFIGTFGLIINSTFPTVYIYYYIWVIPFLMLHTGYVLFKFIERKQIQYRLQVLLFTFLFILTVPMLAKRIHFQTIFEQMKINQKVVNELGNNEKILTCWPGIIMAENIHYLFFQTEAKINDKLVLKSIVENKSFEKWIPKKLISDANYNAKKIVEVEMPLYIYATNSFLKSWELEELINKDYKFTGHHNIYKRIDQAEIP